jgi:hypothetical protein
MAMPAVTAGVVVDAPDLRSLRAMPTVFEGGGLGAMHGGHRPCAPGSQVTTTVELVRE